MFHVIVYAVCSSLEWPWHNSETQHVNCNVAGIIHYAQQRLHWSVEAVPRHEDRVQKERSGLTCSPPRLVKTVRKFFDTVALSSWTSSLCGMSTCACAVPTAPIG